MIKVNLLGDEAVIDHSGKLFLAGYVLSLVVAVVACGFLYVYSSNRLASLRDRKQVLSSELNELKKVTKEVRDLEKLKDELGTKLKVMAKLKRAKPGPVRILDDLNAAVPDRSWLTSVDEKRSEMKIAGIALDNETIAAFMQDLEKSDYVVTVDLDETKQVDQKGAKVKEFAIKAKIDYSATISSVLTDEERAALGEGSPR